MKVKFYPQYCMFVLHDRHYFPTPHFTVLTLIPVFVASRDASTNGSNIGLNATVNAQSTMCPEMFLQQKKNETGYINCKKQSKTKILPSVPYKLQTFGLLTIYMSSKIQFHHIIILKYSFISRVGGPMCCHPAWSNIYNYVPMESRRNIKGKQYRPKTKNKNKNGSDCFMDYKIITNLMSIL